MSDQINLWRDCGIPKQLLGYGFEELQESAKVRSQEATVANWVASIPDHNAEDMNGIPVNRDSYGRGLLLAGPPGTGKTTLACSALTMVRRNYYRSVFFTTFQDYVHARQVEGSPRMESLEILDAISVMRTVRRVNECFLVVLDDVGHEHSSGSGYSERLLAEVLRSRYHRGLPTIVTTNLGAKAWEQRYDAALRSFIRQACTPLEFVGSPDFREAVSHAR